MARKQKVERPKESSLLAQVEEKERLLEGMLNEAREKGTREVEAAKEEARRYVEEVKRGLPEIADHRRQSGLKAVEEEIQRIKQEGRLRLQALVQEAGKHSEEAKKRALKVYLPEIE
ncbi:MAG: V-type ATPase subunit subunit G family protein [Candidatus Brocadiaceae bacterium]|nr:V-type ATPase subunit subunit G family protein [Candidatus Brocadiaceae bacterium]